jgi:PAS domain S-box-containing protein
MSQISYSILGGKMRNDEEGMEKLLTMEKALNGMMEMHRLVLELKDLESRHQKKIQGLEASERRYRTFLDSIPLRLCIKDRDSLYVYCNEQYARDLNIRAEEIAGKREADFFPTDSVEKYRLDDQKILETGIIEEAEEAYAPAGGQELVVHKISSPVRDERAEVIGILNIFWDITEQKRNEKELRKYRAHLEELLSERTSELQRTHERLQWEVAKIAPMEDQLRKTGQNWKTCFDHPGLAMALIGVEDTTLSGTNQGFRTLFGISGEVEGPQKLTDFVCQGDLERMKHDFSAWLEGGERQSSRREYDFIHKEEEKKNIAVTWALMPEKGKVIVSFLDVTELREAENNLRKSEEKHRSLFENAPIAISVIQDGMFRFINLEGIRVIGHSREDLTSRSVLDLACPDFREEFKNLLNRAENGAGPMIYSWQMARTDGQSKWLESKMVNIQWEGNPAVLNFMTDVTTLKESLEELCDAVRAFRPVMNAVERISLLWKGEDQGKDQSE